MINHSLMSQDVRQLENTSNFDVRNSAVTTYTKVVALLRDYARPAGSFYVSPNPWMLCYASCPNVHHVPICILSQFAFCPNLFSDIDCSTTAHLRDHLRKSKRLPHQKVRRQISCTLCFQPTSAAVVS